MFTRLLHTARRAASVAAPLAACLGAGAVALPAHAGVNWSIGISAPIAPGVQVGTVIGGGGHHRHHHHYRPPVAYVPAPVVYAPPPVYAAPVYAPPVYAAPVVVAPRPVVYRAPVVVRHHHHHYRAPVVVRPGHGHHAGRPGHDPPTARVSDRQVR